MNASIANIDALTSSIDHLFGDLCINTDGNDDAIGFDESLSIDNEICRENFELRQQLTLKQEEISKLTLFSMEQENKVIELQTKLEESEKSIVDLKKLVLALNRKLKNRAKICRGLRRDIEEIEDINNVPQHQRLCFVDDESDSNSNISFSDIEQEHYSLNARDPSTSIKIKEESVENEEEQRDNSTESESDEIEIYEPYTPAANLYCPYSDCDDSALFMCHPSFQSHMLFDHGENKPYQCAKCPKKFASVGSLRSHDQKIHGFERRIKSEEIENEEDEDSEESDSESNDEQTLQSHKTNERKEESDIEESENSQEEIYSNHNHKKPYLCKRCNSRFSREESYKLHSANIHKIYNGESDENENEDEKDEMSQSDNDDQMQTQISVDQFIESDKKDDNIDDEDDEDYMPQLTHLTFDKEDEMMPALMSTESDEDDDMSSQSSSFSL